MGRQKRATRSAGRRASGTDTINRTRYIEALRPLRQELFDEPEDLPDDGGDIESWLQEHRSRESHSELF